MYLTPAIALEKAVALPSGSVQHSTSPLVRAAHTSRRNAVPLSSGNTSKPRYGPATTPRIAVVTAVVWLPAGHTGYGPCDLSVPFGTPGSCPPALSTTTRSPVLVNAQMSWCTARLTKTLAPSPPGTLKLSPLDVALDATPYGNQHTTLAPEETIVQSGLDEYCCRDASCAVGGVVGG